MFDYTQVAWKQVVADFQKVLYIIGVASQAVYIGYLLYSLIAGTGVLWVNIALFALSVAYFVFFLVTTKGGKAPDGAKNKLVKKLGAKIYKACKLLLRIYPIALTIYGLYQTAEHVSFLAILLVCMMIIGWILQIVFEVIGAILSNRFALMLDAVKADVEEIKRPVTGVTNFFKKITGKEVETPKEPNKNQLKLREKVELFRVERQEKKAQHQAEFQERRKQAKIEAKEKKSAQKQEKANKKIALKTEKKLLKSAEKRDKAQTKMQERQPLFPSESSSAEHAAALAPTISSDSSAKRTSAARSAQAVSTSAESLSAELSPALLPAVGTADTSAPARADKKEKRKKKKREKGDVS